MDIVGKKVRKVRHKMVKQWSLEMSPIVHLEASLCKHVGVFNLFS
jgi:hypothetical protein